MLYGEKMKQILEKAGIKREDLKDNLYSTLLDEIEKVVESGGGGSGGGQPIVVDELPKNPAINTMYSVNGELYYTAMFSNYELYETTKQTYKKWYFIKENIEEELANYEYDEQLYGCLCSEDENNYFSYKFFNEGTTLILAKYNVDDEEEYQEVIYENGVWHKDCIESDIELIQDEVYGNLDLPFLEVVATKKYVNNNNAEREKNNAVNAKYDFMEYINSSTLAENSVSNSMIDNGRNELVIHSTFKYLNLISLSSNHNLKLTRKPTTMESISLYQTFWSAKINNELLNYIFSGYNEGTIIGRMEGTFVNSSLDKFDLPKLDIRPYNVSNCFWGCKSLKIIKGLNLNDISIKSYVKDFLYNCVALEELELFNIKYDIQIGSGTTYGHLLTLDSLLHTIKELIDTGSSKTLTMGSANLDKLANVYVKLTGAAEEDEANPKFPFEVCESTDEGAMTITDYVSGKNWVLA